MFCEFPRHKPKVRVLETSLQVSDPGSSNWSVGVIAPPFGKLCLLVKDFHKQRGKSGKFTHTWHTHLYRFVAPWYVYTGNLYETYTIIYYLNNLNLVVFTIYCNYKYIDVLLIIIRGTTNLSTWLVFALHLPDVQNTQAAIKPLKYRLIQIKQWIIGLVNVSYIYILLIVL